MGEGEGRREEIVERRVDVIRSVSGSGGEVVWGWDMYWVAVSMQAERMKGY
jgi:hypothetical protein